MKWMERRPHKCGTATRGWMRRVVVECRRDNNALGKRVMPRLRSLDLRRGAHSTDMALLRSLWVSQWSKATGNLRSATERRSYHASRRTVVVGRVRGEGCGLSNIHDEKCRLVASSATYSWRSASTGSMSAARTAG